MRLPFAVALASSLAGAVMFYSSGKEGAELLWWLLHLFVCSNGTPI